MFQLNANEAKSLVLQIARAKGRGGRRTPPYAFTEQGVAMLSSVLGSDRAIDVNITIMRAFVRLREMLATHKDLAAKIEDLERKYRAHGAVIKKIFQSISELMNPKPVPPSRQIGFVVREKK